MKYFLFHCSCITLLLTYLRLSPKAYNTVLLLFWSYEKQGKQDKANTYYQKIIEKYNGTEAATEALLIDFTEAGDRTWP